MLHLTSQTTTAGMANGLGANMANFDQNDMSSWYFRGLSRAEATRLLLKETESGVFLVRDSNTIHGDYVLCVREDERVSHYIINRVVTEGTVRYRIGDQLFTDMPALLAFYRLHFLDTTPLTRPLQPQPTLPAADEPLEVVVAKYDFNKTDPEDLAFRRGEHLWVLRRDEQQWWTARNGQGQVGSIPVPYVERLSDLPKKDETQAAGSASPAPENPARPVQRVLPALARVRQSRVPNAYDKTALKLEEGDVIKVTKMNINGQWEGELNGKTGHFPFTHVEFLEPLNNTQ